MENLCHDYETKVLNRIKEMCERFEFTIQWGYGMTKVSVSKIKVVIEDKRVKKCFENLFSNCTWYQVGNGNTKKQYISVLMNKAGTGIFSPDCQEPKFVENDKEPFAHIENIKRIFNSAPYCLS